MEPQTRVVEKYRVVLTESYENESVVAKDIDTKEEAIQKAEKIKKDRDSFGLNCVSLERRCEVIPYKTRIPVQGLPRKGDLMYVPEGLEKLVSKPSFKSCQIGISGGLAEVSSVREYGDLGSCNWFVNFDDLNATYSLEYLTSVQDELKAKYKHHSAEPIYDNQMKGFFREMEDYD